MPALPVYSNLKNRHTVFLHVSQILTFPDVSVLSTDAYVSIYPNGWQCYLVKYKTMHTDIFRMRWNQFLCQLDVYNRRHH